MSNVSQGFLSAHQFLPYFSSATFSCVFSALCTAVKMAVWTDIVGFAFFFLREGNLSSENVLVNSLLLNVQSE